MLASRISCAFFSWALFLALGMYFFYREGFSILTAFLTSAMLWAVTITTPLAMPYWFGFMYDLGELNSILLVGWGLMFISRWPFLSAFIFGLAVWHGKLIYLPLVCAVLLGDVLAKNFPVKKTLTQLLGLLGVFILPAILWLIFTCFRLDTHTIHSWLEGQLAWFSSMLSKHKPLPQVFSHQVHWMDRFSSPDLEWSHYSTGTKIKNIILSWGAILMAGASLFYLKNSTGLVSPRGRWTSIMVLLCLAGYSFHFFFLHPFMWQRHFQPALYSGLALWVFWGTKWVIFFQNRLKMALILAVLLILAMQLVSSLKHPLFSTTPTYARACTDLRALSCDPTHKENLPHTIIF